jgi:hypothetical protein
MTKSLEERRAAWRSHYQANREKIIEQHRAWQARNSLKEHARYAVQSAQRAGKLAPLPCIICGDTKVEAHHASYDPQDRLSVTWLCSQHHKQVHTEHRRYQLVPYTPYRPWPAGRIHRSPEKIAARKHRQTCAHVKHARVHEG